MATILMIVVFVLALLLAVIFGQALFTKGQCGDWIREARDVSGRRLMDLSIGQLIKMTEGRRGPKSQVVLIDLLIAVRNLERVVHGTADDSDRELKEKLVAFILSSELVANHP